MHVSSTFIPGAYTRPAPAPAAATSSETFKVDEDARPRFFRSISSISYGSLADAYVAMKAQDSGGGTAVSANAPAVLSASGVSGALDAYAQVLEDA
jgi:hypothetical protein